ncbi:hypothetical protein [Bacillus mycoides]|uniref:hypothetical protein n=1 Tax=Bacillus mycoides TaxID=1405 RepID=UPI0037FD9CCA
MDDLKIFTLVVTTTGVIITAFLTHHFTLRREKYAKTFEYKLKIVTELYAPIYRKMTPSMRPLHYGYQGISIKTFKEIEEIIEENIELVDPVLQHVIWELRERCYILSDHPKGEGVGVDTDRELLDYIQYQFNSIRKELKLPYDSTTLSFRTKLNIYKKKKERNKVYKRDRRSVQKYF